MNDILDKNKEEEEEEDEMMNFVYIAPSVH